jgi:hypothetical protein
MPVHVQYGRILQLRPGHIHNEDTKTGYIQMNGHITSGTDH